MKLLPSNRAPGIADASDLRDALRALLLAMLAACSIAAHAVEARIGMSISVEGDGFFLNPIVSRITVKEVERSSLAAAAGIVAGDEILQIDGQPVAGRRARDLQGYMKFNPGETRTLRLRHENGNPFEARLTKPKD